MAESRIRDSYEDGNPFENGFGNSLENRGRDQEPELSLIKLEGFEVITQGDYVFDEPTEVSSSSSATTSMSSSTSVVTSSSRGFSPATNPLLTTSSVFSESTVPETEEDVVTVQPFPTVEEELLEEIEKAVEEEKKQDTDDEIEKEGAGDNSDELSESDYFYSIYGDEYPFEYADYINYSDEPFDDSVLANGSPVKTFTVGQDSGKGKGCTQG